MEKPEASAANDNRTEIMQLAHKLGLESVNLDDPESVRAAIAQAQEMLKDGSPEAVDLAEKLLRLAKKDPDLAEKMIAPAAEEIAFQLPEQIKLEIDKQVARGLITWKNLRNVSALVAGANALVVGAPFVTAGGGVLAIYAAYKNIKAKRSSSSEELPKAA